MKANMWSVISVIFLVWAVGASMMAASYYQSSQSQQKTIDGLQALVDEVTIKANIAINYGNGTVAWFNGTVLPNDVTLFNATKKVANLTYDTYAFGIFITGINGVMQNASSGKYWVYDSWSNGTWVPIWSGVIEYKLAHNETIMWTLKAFT